MSKGKIIILEDDVELQETLAEYLTLKGFEVACAGCALDFFQALVGVDYDMALVDIGLPDKSGFEVVEHLRQRTSMTIIVLTARDSIRDKMRGYKAGADHYFTKPLDLRELSAVIESIMERLGESAACMNADGKWVLDPLRWTLASPGGKAVKLTEKEMRFMELLVSEDGGTVPRDTLLEAMDYKTDEAYGSRALAVLVTRLRKKIREQTGLEPPITSIRSQGYSFSAPSGLV